MNVTEFARRRRHLMEAIGAGGIAVLPAATEKVRSRDTLFDYRPDSDFYYLTGFVEPEAVESLLAVMQKMEYGENACIIGEVIADHPGQVVMQTSIGSSRIVDMLHGEPLPRIC